MASLGLVPAQPAAIAPGALPPPAAAADPLAPTAAEAVSFRLYYQKLISIRGVFESLVTEEELATWGSYANAAEASLMEAQLLRTVRQLECKAENCQIRNSVNAGLGRNDPLRPLVKECQGAGPPLPGGAAAPLALPVGHPLAVGTPMPSPPFPATIADSEALTAAQLNALAIAYNNTFGIVDGDTLAEKRQKFLEWIVWKPQSNGGKFGE